MHALTVVFLLGSTLSATTSTLCAQATSSRVDSVIAQLAPNARVRVVTTEIIPRQRQLATRDANTAALRLPNREAALDLAAIDSLWAYKRPVEAFAAVGGIGWGLITASQLQRHVCKVQCDVHTAAESIILGGMMGFLAGALAGTVVGSMADPWRLRYVRLTPRAGSTPER